MEQEKSIFQESYTQYKYPKAIDEIRKKYGLEYVAEQNEEEVDPQVKQDSEELKKTQKKNLEKKVAIAKQEQKNLDAKMTSMKST